MNELEIYQKLQAFFPRSLGDNDQAIVDQKGFYESHLFVNYDEKEFILDKFKRGLLQPIVYNYTTAKKRFRFHVVMIQQVEEMTPDERTQHSGQFKLNYVMKEKVVAQERQSNVN